MLTNCYHTPHNHHTNTMPLDYDEDEFNDFLGKIEDVDSIIKDLVEVGLTMART